MSSTKERIDDPEVGEKAGDKWSVIRRRIEKGEQAVLEKASKETHRSGFLWARLQSHVHEKVEPETENKVQKIGRSNSVFTSGVQQLHHTKLFEEVRAEVMRATSGQTIQERDVDALQKFTDYASYILENSVSAIPGIALYLLVLSTVSITIFLSVLWCFVIDEPLSLERITTKIFQTIQLLTTGGFTDAKLAPPEKLIFVVGLFLGLVIIAILLAIITDAFAHKMAHIAEGKTKVIEHGHTLILGWNESTIRVVCQIAFLRRGFLKQNETWARILCPWLRVKPSSPVAQAPVIVMADNMTKEEMDAKLAAALAESGISPHLTCIGWDVVVRVGKPDDPHDLIRVNAHQATAILITTTEKDLEIEEKSKGKVKNGATIRTLLALRHVLYGNETALETMDARNIRIVSHFGRTCEYSDAATYVSPKGHRIVFNLDLNYFTNALMFWCAAKPGLSQVYLQILNFEGFALRCRPARDLHAGPKGEKGYLAGKKIKDVINYTYWSNAIMIGLCPDARLEKALATSVAAITGCCADPERTILESDLIIFLSSMSSPKVSRSHETTTAYNQDIRGLSLQALDQALNTVTVAESSPERKENAISILVCGWKADWDEGAPLRRRLVDIAARIPLGSNISFLNEMDPSEFKELMLTIGAVERNGPDKNGWVLEEIDIIRGCPTNIHITHYFGDAADIHDLSPLLSGDSNTDRFQTAIILGSSKLPRELQDARILSVLLLLRHLSQHWVRHLHVIADNYQDQTASIAVTPNHSGSQETLPDFLPSTTIEARALTIALAYPQMQGAIEEFFVDDDPEDGTPIIDFIDIVKFGIIGRRFPFSLICKAVSKITAGWAICFGLMTSEGEMILAPPPETDGIPLRKRLGTFKTRTYAKGDRVIVMRRMFPAGK